MQGFASLPKKIKNKKLPVDLIVTGRMTVVPQISSMKRFIDDIAFVKVCKDVFYDDDGCWCFGGQILIVNLPL